MRDGGAVQRDAAITNALTVDVEDYFQVTAFEDVVARSHWPSFPARVERNVDRIMELFAQADVKATFFVLGWVAERQPQMVRRLLAAGHEIASHGYHHVRVSRQTAAEFREDVVIAKRLLEDIGGTPVNGYRAPSYSIGRDNLWALEILREAGYRYSSSIYPIRHDLYGMQEAARFAHHPRAQGVLEIPIATVIVFGQKLPCGGGGYFRLLPYPVSRWAMQRVNQLDRQPCVFYFHPWEIDPQQPRPAGLRLKSRVRHYLNLARMERRLNRLLRDFKWDRMDRIYLAGRPGGAT